MQLPTGLGQTFEIFRGFDSETIERLLTGWRREENSHRDLIFKAGQTAEEFGLVISGCYKIYKPSAQNSTFCFARRGELIAALLMSHHVQKYPVQIESVGDSVLIRLPRSTYLDSWLSHPGLMERVQTSIQQRCLRFHGVLAHQRLSLKSRLAALLLSYAEGEEGESSLRIAFPLTRKDLSQMVGAEIESVIRIMSQWEKNMIISTRASRVVILDAKALQLLIEDEGSHTS